MLIAPYPLAFEHVTVTMGAEHYRTYAQSSARALGEIEYRMYPRFSVYAGFKRDVVDDGIPTEYVFGARMVLK